MEKLLSSLGDINYDRLNEIKDSQYFLDELDTLNNSTVFDYYKYLVKNVSLNKENTSNSYVMWVLDKVDELNVKKSAYIIAGSVSLPDIDMDVPANKRDSTIEYLKDKYGPNNVSQMLTFGRLQGRSAIKEVLRVNAACGFSEMNEITKFIPDEAAISDQLAEMDDEDRSIIRWALINNADDLRDYCHIDKNGNLHGDYSEFFQQAIDIEGTFKTQGKHAAGVVISAGELYKVCPMANQKSGKEKIAGLEMADLEALGHVKFDLLALSLLDKVMRIRELLENQEK
jgi:DNA polymerase-3 subunit alpha